MGWVLAGNIVGGILADFGAEVIKVESHTHLDPAREGRPIIGDELDPEQSPMFHNAARGKRSMLVDIKREAGRELVRRLVAVSDIFIENMTPHALNDAELSYEHLRKVNPRIIMISFPMAPRNGPFEDLRGYGPTAGSLVGLDSLAGYADEPKPLGFGFPLGDPNAALHGVLALLAAVEHRRVTGEGQYIQTSMWETLVTQLAYPLMDYTMNKRVAKPNGNGHPTLVPHGIYPCVADGEMDKWISIAVGTDAEWSSLCEVLGDRVLAADRRFATAGGRRANEDELNAAIGLWTSKRTQAEAAEALQQAGVAAMPCLDQEGRFFNEHLAARECFVYVDHPVLGSEPLYNTPIKLSESPGGVQGPAPRMGQDTESVCREILGLSRQEVDELMSSKVLF